MGNGQVWLELTKWEKYERSVDNVLKQCEILRGTHDN